MLYAISVCGEPLVVLGSMLTNTDENKLHPTKFNAKHQYNILLQLLVTE
jgi:hypothetical protein